MAQSWEYIDPNDYDDVGRMEILSNAINQSGELSQDTIRNVRSFIVCQTAQYRSIGDGQKYPLTLDILNINVKYLGHPSGKWQYDYAPDNNENHIRRDVFDVNDLDLNEKSISGRFYKGAIYVLSSGPSEVFYPALKNLNMKTSEMFNGMYFGFAAADVIHITHRNWFRLVGSNLTEEQMIERTLTFTQNEITHRFDQRYQYVVDPKVLPPDHNRRYSWTTDIKIIGTSPRYVNKLNILGTYM